MPTAWCIVAVGQSRAMGRTVAGRNSRASQAKARRALSARNLLSRATAPISRSVRRGIHGE